MVKFLGTIMELRLREEIEALEEEELERAEQELIQIFDSNHQFSARDLCNIHELWLGDIYPSAGKYRTVSMKKDEFIFAAPNQISKLMNDFEKNFLKKYTPCFNFDSDILISALAIVHVKLILIHPFREGNGRTARLLADLMAIQAGKPPLDFLYLDQTANGKGYDEYILAIHAGVAMHYEPMRRIFSILLEASK